MTGLDLLTMGASTMSNNNSNFISNSHKNQLRARLKELRDPAYSYLYDTDFKRRRRDVKTAKLKKKIEREG